MSKRCAGPSLSWAYGLVCPAFVGCWRRCLTLLLWLVFCVYPVADAFCAVPFDTATGSHVVPPLVQADTLMMPLSARIDVLIDPDGVLVKSDMERPELAARFEPWASPSDLNFGFSRSTYWLRFPLQRSADAPSDWLLEVAYSPISELDVYAPGYQPVITGSALPVASRVYFNRFFVFPVTLALEPAYVYVRVRSSFSLTIPVQLWRVDAFQRHNSEVQLVQFMYFGFYAALLIYNSFLFVSLRDPRFFYFSVYVLAFGTAMFAGNGFGRLFLWPDSPAFDEVAQLVLLSVSASVVLALSRLFLRIREFSPRLASMLRFEQWLSAGFAVALLGGPVLGYPTDVVNQLIVVNGIAICLLVLYAGVVAYRQGLQGSHFFVWAWWVFCCGGLVAACRLFGWLPTNAVTAYALQIASVFEMMLLAMALADAVRRERDVREAEQARTLRRNTRVLQLLKASEERLENAVRERTAQLEQALKQQKDTLGQYVRFGSLLSHEFRNPLGVIESQISLLVKERERGIDQQEKRVGVMLRATRRLTGLFDKWLQSDRLASALEEVNRHRIPLHDWVKKLLDEQAHVTDSHRLVLALDPQLGVIEADESLLDIALLNLLDNAAKYSPQGTTIALSTHCHEGWLGISVLDQGPGIDVAEQAKVFDEFYRCAPESSVRGMGLGLAMVQRIAKAHGGWVELTSSLGQGACFCIWLPRSPGD